MAHSRGQRSTAHVGDARWACPCPSWRLRPFNVRIFKELGEGVLRQRVRVVAPQHGDPCCLRHVRHTRGDLLHQLPFVWPLEIARNFNAGLVWKWGKGVKAAVGAGDGVAIKVRQSMSVWMRVKVWVRDGMWKGVAEGEDMGESSEEPHGASLGHTAAL